MDKGIFLLLVLVSGCLGGPEFETATGDPMTATKGQARQDAQQADADPPTPDAGSPVPEASVVASPEAATVDPSDASDAAPDSPVAVVVDSGPPDTGPVGDAGLLACLVNAPASCDPCNTGNPGDAPLCRRYIQCFVDHQCIPTDDACTGTYGRCGPVALGYGVLPLLTAISNYKCACP